MARGSNTGLGIAFKLLSTGLFVLMSAILKATADTIPVGEQVFFRSCFAVPVTLLWLASRRELRTGLIVAHPMGHVYRGLVGTVAMALTFVGIGILPLPETTAIGFTAPLLVVVFAAMFLGEEVRLFRISAVGLGLIGVLVILSPRLGGAEQDARAALGASVALMGAVFAALAQIFIRKLTATESTSAIVFWFSCTSTALSLVTLPFGWVLPAPADLALLITAGLIGGLAQILLTSAYRLADASIVAPFEYSAMLWALLLGFFVFGEVPSGVMLAGSALVITVGSLIVWRERPLGIARARAAAQ